MKAPSHAPHFATSRPLPTPGQLVRAEAKRRGGRFAEHADHYAALAERWYGRRPLRGDELRTMLDDVLGNG
ncbi:hypothetical protein [Burkholderia diffusa]|uniref:hypothetical protein n=1 Tax=Burkholderia diffusa TaxID=488732 RepID=UPI000753DFB2|nr:hypothetical protein [Burkholderia diffusa]KVH51196.1 hypothetical protein WJ39_08565 [Burkholderia diffusa]